MISWLHYIASHIFPQVVDIMRVNVDKVLERDQKLSELDDRADALQAGASQFETSAAKLKNKYWWKNAKVRTCTHAYLNSKYVWIKDALDSSTDRKTKRRACENLWPIKTIDFCNCSQVWFFWTSITVLLVCSGLEFLTQNKAPKKIHAIKFVLVIRAFHRKKNYS